ncbi:MAG: DUF523 domain-containing protein [Candidatus Cloacimonetes bacterium]|nr:DUF523 domain-containing protein [Candidatus Cloacimonadota bacterium]
MPKYLISACLAGLNCKYDGGNNLHLKIMKLVNSGEAILICPEQLGGLPTPRPPAEIIENKVININGEDVTVQFQKGAQEALLAAQNLGITYAILKERSPSCGVHYIYDGTHSGKIIPGQGITTSLLQKHNIKILSEKDL